jgi:hypothetical protein
MNGPIAQFWLERTPDKREVTGSSPVRPTTKRREEKGVVVHLEPGAWESGGCSSAGRAPALHAGGHRFDPVHLHHFTAIKSVEWRR